MLFHPNSLTLMEERRGRREGEQFSGKKMWVSEINSLKKASFSAWLKEYSEGKVSNADLDTADKSDNFKIITCGLTEQETKRQNRNWFKTGLGLGFSSLWPIFHFENRTQEKMQILFVKLFSFFMCEHINISFFCRLLMEFSCNVCLELEGLVFLIIDMSVYNHNFMSH